MYSTFRGNIWGTDLANMQLISKFSEGFRVLLGIRYAWVDPLKNKKGVNAFQKKIFITINK